MCKRFSSLHYSYVYYNFSSLAFLLLFFSCKLQIPTLFDLAYRHDKAVARCGVMKNAECRRRRNTWVCLYSLYSKQSCTARLSAPLITHVNFLAGGHKMMMFTNRTPHPAICCKKKMASLHLTRLNNDKWAATMSDCALLSHTCLISKQIIIHHISYFIFQIFHTFHSSKKVVPP